MCSRGASSGSLSKALNASPAPGGAVSPTQDTLIWHHLRQLSVGGSIPECLHDHGRGAAEQGTELWDDNIYLQIVWVCEWVSEKSDDWVQTG